MAFLPKSKPPRPKYTPQAPPTTRVSRGSVSRPSDPPVGRFVANGPGYRKRQL